MLYMSTFPPPSPPPPLVGSTTLPCHCKYFSQDTPTRCVHAYTHARTQHQEVRDKSGATADGQALRKKK